MKILHTKLKIFIALILAVLIISNPVLFSYSVSAAGAVASETDAELKKRLEELEKELKQIEADKKVLQDKILANQYIINGYQTQLSQLHGEVLIYKSEVKELEIQIQAIELNLDYLETEISKKKDEIGKTENVVKALEQESHIRISNSYMQFRMYGSDTSNDNIFNLDSINSYFKDSQYKEIIQSDTNKILTQLAILRQKLKDQKESLNSDLVAVKKDKEILDIKRDDLEKKKTQLDSKIIAYYTQINDLSAKVGSDKDNIATFEKNEAQKQAEAEALKDKIFNKFTPKTSGSRVTAGTRIGSQGSTGWSTGPHLHFGVQVNGQYSNPCAYLPSGYLSGCGGNGSLQMPLTGQMYFTSGFGYRCFTDTFNGKQTCQYHNGIDVAGVPWNTPIYAAQDGYLYKGVDGYGALYIVICQNQDCRTGTNTAYWHLSEY